MRCCARRRRGIICFHKKVRNAVECARNLQYGLQTYRKKYQRSVAPVRKYKKVGRRLFCHFARSSVLQKLHTRWLYRKAGGNQRCSKLGCCRHRRCRGAAIVTVAVAVVSGPVRTEILCCCLHPTPAPSIRHTGGGSSYYSGKSAPTATAEATFSRVTTNHFAAAAVTTSRQKTYSKCVIFLRHALISASLADIRKGPFLPS